MEWLGSGKELGTKAINLGRMLKMGLPVPIGFVVDNQDDVRIPSGYQTIGYGPVAVRSSGMCEDGRYSFAGVHKTSLNVIGIRAIRQAIQECIDSASSNNAAAYRLAMGLKPDKVSAIVQKMVAPSVSGVMFTVNPMNGDREVIIEGINGLGERLMQGAVPDYSMVIGHGTTRSYKHTGYPIPSWQLICRYGRTLEQEFGCPQDVEWCIDRMGKVWLLQTRPITTI